MRLAVLDLTEWQPEYMNGLPKCGEELARWVRLGLPDAEITVIDVVGGEPLPAAGDFDGYVVSGSDKGVYDDTVWMEPLKAFLLHCKDAGKPLFGVCFGHQIMAEAFGGKAEKIGEPEVGVRSFSVDDTRLEAHVWHQDQVTEVPPDAHVIAQSSYCPVAGLAYDFPAMSFQFHPEYKADYIATVLERTRGVVLSEEECDKALAQLADSEVPVDLYADQLAQLFKKALGGQNE